MLRQILLINHDLLQLLKITIKTITLNIIITFLKQFKKQKKLNICVIKYFRKIPAKTIRSGVKY